MRGPAPIFFLWFAAIAACTGLAVPDSQAQGYPSKPIRLLVGFTAGAIAARRQGEVPQAPRGARHAIRQSQEDRAVARSLRPRKDEQAALSLRGLNSRKYLINWVGEIAD